MAESALHEITQRALAAYAKLDLPESAVMIAAEPPRGTSFWPKALEQSLFKGNQGFAKDWYVGEFVTGTKQLVLVNDEASWKSVGDLGAGVMRAIASVPQQERFAVAMTPAWKRMDAVLTPIVDGVKDGLPLNQSPRYVMPEDMFKGLWATLVIQQILASSNDLLTTERWLEFDNKPIEYDPANDEHTWWYATPVSIAAAVSELLRNLSSAWGETISKSAPVVDAVALPHQCDYDGFVIKPLDEKAYVSHTDLLNDHCVGTGFDTAKKLTRELDKCKDTVRQWRPRSNRRFVHLGDWHAHIKRITQRSDSGHASDPSPEEIKRRKQVIHDNRIKGLGGE